MDICIYGYMNLYSDTDIQIYRDNVGISHCKNGQASVRSFE